MDGTIEIVNQSIDVARLIERVTNPDSGAVNIFIGTVRNRTKERAVVRLEYEAYEPMAIQEIARIVQYAIERWGIRRYAVSHRVGTLTPGDIAVVIALTTPHRQESFEACQYIIDTIKETVPIWKKEVFEGGEEWVSATP